MLQYSKTIDIDIQESEAMLVSLFNRQTKLLSVPESKSVVTNQKM